MMMMVMSLDDDDVEDGDDDGGDVAADGYSAPWSRSRSAARSGMAEQYSQRPEL